jgi:hypothetical protein
MQNTTMPSTKDELLEIERSAQMMGNGGGKNDGAPSQRTLDSSCTSMYVEDDSFYNSSFSTEMSWQSSKASMDHRKNSVPPGGPRRNSVLMTPTGMLGLNDIDFEDSDDDDSATPKPAPASGTGNPNHRPLVGGFAAAAYEAARADHFKKQQEKKPSA